MSKFIYVFDLEDRDRLLKLGYNLLSSNNDKCVFVFENNKEIQEFSKLNKKYVMTDVLTF